MRRFYTGDLFVDERPEPDLVIMRLVTRTDERRSPVSRRTGTGAPRHSRE